ncbi:MAG: hypothetical protein KKF50_01650 [Nanoarchaeota archaeon]|nr:hypothetical protein [Nanoarchaeota archaeon]
MNNYKEQKLEEGYTTISYPHEGGITHLEIPHQIDNQPSHTEDSKLVAVIKE